VNFTTLLTDAEITELMAAGIQQSIHHELSMSAYNRPGEQAGLKHGAGMDFAEYKTYQQGDDPRFIDWRASARSQHTLTRRYNADSSQPLFIVIDRSSSMRFGTRKRLKVTQALRAAILLSASEIDNGKEIAAFLINETYQWIPAKQGMASLKSIIHQANLPCSPVNELVFDVAWSEVFVNLKQKIPEGSRLFLFSDFNSLSMGDLGYLKEIGQHCNTSAFVISDPAEYSLSSFSGLLSWGAINKRISSSQKKITHNFFEQRRKHDEFLEVELDKAKINHKKVSTVDELINEVG